MTRKPRKLIRLFIASAGFIPAGALSLGLGPIQIYSSLNQALDAQIELLSPEVGELKALSVKLASPQFFEQAGIERPALLSELGFSVQTRPDGRHVIKVTSRRPIREPALNFLIELNGTTGRVVKEFAVLLDPPDFESPAPLSAQWVRSVRPEANSERRPAPPRPTPAQFDGEVYGPVAFGETLWRIAERVRPASVSVEQMMQALLRANPQAFLEPHIDRLMAGVNLRMPSAEELAAVGARVSPESPAQQGEQAAQAPQAPEQPADVSAERRLVAPEETVDEPQPAPEIIKSDLSPQAMAGSAPAITTPYRIKLEGSGVKLRLAGIDDLQSRIGTLMAVDHATLVAVPSSAAEEPPAPIPAAQDAAPVETVAVSEAEEVAPASIEEASLAETAAAPELEDTTAAETPLASVAGQSASSVETAVNSPPALKESVPAEPSMVEDILATMTGNPKSLALTGFGSLLLIALVGLLIRRLRAMESLAEAEEEIDTPPSAASLDDSPAVAAAAVETAVAASERSPNGLASAPSASVVNPLERADLLMAVGNLREAENTVRLALAEDPANIALVAKLLEIRSAMGNAEGFREEAERLRDMIEDSADPLWRHVVDMGSQLCPGDALFGGATESSLSAFKEQKPTVTTEATAGVDTEDLDLELERYSAKGQPADPQSILAAQGFDPSPEVAARDDDDSSAALAAADEDLDFEALAEPRSAPSSVRAEEDALLESLDMDWQPAVVESPAAESDRLQAEADIEDHPYELTLDLEELPEQKPSTQPETDDEPDELEIDLHTLDFELGQESAAPVTEGDLVDEDYVDTKLDLAVAYLDMEDPIGAHGLLEEVLQEGNVGQRQRAEELMQRLASKEEPGERQAANAKAC